MNSVHIHMRLGAHFHRYTDSLHKVAFNHIRLQCLYWSWVLQDLLVVALFRSCSSLKYPVCELCETQSLWQYGILRYKRPVSGLIEWVDAIEPIMKDKRQLWFTGRFLLIETMKWGV